MLNPIVVVPARKGSKGIPSKNTKLLNGKPLIAYTLETALEIFRPNQICVTTDDPAVVDIAKSYKIAVPFLRPAHLASDNVGMEDVIRHAIANFKPSKGDDNFDTIVLLQPTSPFRKAYHVKEALDLFGSENLDMVVSVKKTKSNPYYLLFEENELGYLERSKKGNFKTRQECPIVWEYNGAVYIINSQSFHQQTLSEFPRVRKYEMSDMDSIDVDTPHDWRLAETLLTT